MSRQTEARDRNLIARLERENLARRAGAATDAQLDCVIRTYPAAGANAAWRAACVLERAERPAGPWPMSEVEARIRARGVPRYGRQCERQIGVRPTLMYNAVMIPRIVLCPHNALPGSPYCEAHQTVD